MEHIKKFEKLTVRLEIQGLEGVIELINEVKQLRKEVQEYVDKNQKRAYNIKETAEKLGLSVGSVNNKIREGMIFCKQDKPRGVRVISAEEINRYLNDFD